MNNIEKLAIEQMIYEHTGFNPNVADDAETIKHIKKLLEAFAKALQSSEPVWILSRDNKGRTTNVISGFPTKFDISKLSDGTKLFTLPPSTVPLEKYNKVVEALKDLLSEAKQNRMNAMSMNKTFSAVAEARAQQLIAEAEGK